MRKLLITFSSLLLLAACNTATENKGGNSDSASATSANSSQESRETRNKEIAMESVKAVMTGNADEVLKNADTNAVDYNDGTMPPTKGLDSIKAGMKAWLSNIQNYKGENLEAAADGNTVMVYGDWSGTFKKDFMGMKTAGKTFKIKDVDIFTFNNEGKITAHRSVQSSAGLLASMEKNKK